MNNEIKLEQIKLLLTDDSSSVRSSAIDALRKILASMPPKEAYKQIISIIENIENEYTNCKCKR